MDSVNPQSSLQDSNNIVQQIQYESGDIVVRDLLKKLTKYLSASFLDSNGAGGTAADYLCSIIAKQFYLNEQKESEKQNLTLQLHRVLEQYLQTKQLLSDAEELNQTIRHELQSFRDELQNNSNNIRDLEDNRADIPSTFVNCQTEMQIQKERPDVLRHDGAKLTVCKEDTGDNNKQLDDLISYFSEEKSNFLKKMDQFCEYLEELWIGDENVVRSRIISSQLRFARPSHAKFAIQHYLCQLLFAEFEKEDFNVNSGFCMFFDVKDLAKDSFQAYKHYSSVNLEDLAAEVLFNRGKSFSKFYWENLTTAALITEETHCLSSIDSIGTFMQDKVLTGFLEICRAVWTLHKLTFSFQPPARIMRFKKSSDYNAIYMESLLGEGNPDFLPKVGLIAMPGFQVNNTIIVKSIIYPEGKKINCVRFR